MKTILAILILTLNLGLATARVQSGSATKVVEKTPAENTTVTASETSTTASSATTNSSQKWQAANDKYIAGDYPMAILLYEELLGSSEHSAVLYYNLGNAYFRNNNLGKAILNYNRSLLISPANPDTRHNLAVATARTTDKIDPLPRVFLTEWIATVRETISSDTWAVITLIIFGLALAGVTLWLISTTLVLRKIGFYGALATASLTIISLSFSQSGYNKQTSSPQAVVITAMVPVKSSPDASSKDLFVLHEGTTVTTIDVLQGWIEVRSEDGNSGWLPSNTIERVVPSNVH